MSLHELIAAAQTGLDAAVLLAEGGDGEGDGEGEEDEEVDFYKLLNVTSNASSSEIKRAYRKLALKWHPDKCMHEEHGISDPSELEEFCENMFVRLQEAYKVSEWIGR